MFRAMRVDAIAITLALVACGGDDAPMIQPPDGPPPPPDATIASTPACWPHADRTVNGSASLGIGSEGFEPMPEVLQLEWGAQDGYMARINVNVRTPGFAPGNPADILDRSNPHTRIRMYFDDTNVPLNYYAGDCPTRLGYVPSDAGGYELVERAAVIFETCWRSNHLLGARLRVELEVLDGSGGGYATDVKYVIGGGPPEGFPPGDETGAPACDHDYPEVARRDRLPDRLER